MSPRTRRALLRSAAGIAALGAIGTASGRSETRFVTRWTTRPLDRARVTDATVAAGTVVLALEPPDHGERSNGPHLLAFDERGRREWTWQWPADRSPTLGYPQAVAPAADGGLFVAGATDEDEERLRVLELDGERAIRWSETYEHGAAPFSEAHLVRASKSRLVVVGVEYLPGGTVTSATGIDATDHTRRWDRDFDRGRGVASARPHPDGFVVAGDANGVGWVALLSETGATAWDHEFTDDEVDEIDDITPTASGGIVCCGYQEDADGESAVLVELGDDGESRWRASPTVRGPSAPWNYRIVSDPAGGYVFVASFDGSDCFVGKTDSRGVLEYETLVAPRDGPLRLADVLVSGDQFVFVGDVDDVRDETPVWAAGVTRERVTPTATPAATPTTSPTDTPSSTVRNPPESPTATDTVTPVSTDAASPPESTAANGPGLGVAGAVFGTLTTGVVARLTVDRDGGAE